MNSAGKPYLLETMLLGSSMANLVSVGSAQRELEYYNLIDREFDLVLFEYSAPVDGCGFKTIWSEFGNKWVKSIFAPLLKGWGLSGPGVVRSKQLWGAWTAWILAKIRRKKFILRCGYIWSRSVLHERKNLHPSVRWLVLEIEKVIAKRADALIYGSDDIATHYRRLTGKPSVVIPNGFDTCKFKPKSEIPKDFDFIYTGRLIPLKGIERILNTVGVSRTLIVAGSGPLAGMVKARSNVTYLGVVPNHELADVLNRARFFISLSSTEGSPKCLIEAVLCGLYPIVSDIPAHRLLVEELGYGILLGSDDQLDVDLTEYAVDPEKLGIFRQRYSMSSIVEREISFCMQFVQ